MRVKHALYSKKGPRFKGFVNAPLLELGRATKLPDHISVHQPHKCFGYRILQQSIGDSDLFQTVIDLCGSQLGCHPLRSPSPIEIRVSSASPILIRSPSDNTPIITPDDYLQDEEEIEKYISKLTRQEGRQRSVSGEPGPSSRARLVCYFGFANCN